MQGQVDAVQTAAHDAKAAADSAAQSKKDIQDALKKLDNDSSGSIKVGHSETSNPGVVTSVGGSTSKNGYTLEYTLWFTFVERSGFVKTYTPACLNQSIPTGSIVILTRRHLNMPAKLQPASKLFQRSKSKNPVDCLKAARELLSDPKRWGRGSFFDTDEADTATKFCAYGAVMFVDGPAEIRAEQILYDTCMERHSVGTVTFNDSAKTKHKDILALMQR